MKKLLCSLMALVILTGCSCANTNMDNTPTKKVEAFLNRYQTADDNVMNDLDTSLTADTTLTEDERSDYREFMKKHYQDLKYEIKDEKIDGDTATVETEITVRSYKNALNDANTYRNDNKDKFDDKNTFAGYRLENLKKVTDTETYTIYFHLTKTNDEWSVDPLSDEDLNKISGSYGVNSVVTDNQVTDNTNNNTTNNNTNNQVTDNTDNGNTVNDHANDNVTNNNGNS